MVKALEPEIVKAIFEGKNKGLTVREIAKELGISIGVVDRYLKVYGSFENYLMSKKEKEYKRTAYMGIPSQSTAVTRIIGKEAIEYSSKYLAKQHTIFKVVESELEELANKLDISIEELLRIMVSYFKTTVPEYLKLKQENSILKEKLRVYEEAINFIVSLLDEELYTRLKELVAVSTAVETKSKEFLLKLIGG